MNAADAQASSVQMSTGPQAEADWPRLQALYASYGRVLDNGDYAKWPEFFVDDAVYKVQSRENFDRGLPLAAIALESKAMLQDRVIGATDTIFHDPYYQRHVVGVPVLRAVETEGWRCEANYAVFRTKLSEASTVFNVGRYLDRVARTPDGLRFASRECIYDSEMIPNSIIYPI